MSNEPVVVTAARGLRGLIRKARRAGQRIQ
jgi:hypothetical protein